DSLPGSSDNSVLARAVSVGGGLCIRLWQKFGSPIGSSGSCSDTRGGLLEMAPGHHIRFLDPNMEELEREKHYMLMDASGVCFQPVVFPGLGLETEVASFLPWGRLHS
ncbi:RIKEN cDNA C130026L21, isoform CRA_c, partial [Mus musculus]